MKRLAVAGIAVAAVAMAIWWRWQAADAQLAFTYGRSLAEGHGIGEPPTTVAWVLWSALAAKVHVDPLYAAWALGLASLAAVIVVAYRIAELRKGQGLVAAGVIATSATAILYGASGLEVMLQAALVAGVWFELHRLRDATPSIEALIVIGIYTSLALLVRFDSVPMLLVLLVQVAKRLIATRASVRVWIAGAMPILVIVGGFLLWRTRTYGETLPFVRIAGGVSLVGHFALVSALPLLAILMAWKKKLPILPLELIAAQLAYVMIFGGVDARVFVVVIPAIAVAYAELATTWIEAAITLAILAGFSVFA